MFLSAFGELQYVLFLQHFLLSDLEQMPRFLTRRRLAAVA